MQRRPPSRLAVKRVRRTLGPPLALVPVLAVLAACHGKAGETDDTDVAATYSGPVRDCEVYVRTTLPDGVSKVEVGGQWADFQVQELTDDDGDGVYERRLGELHPGTYGFKFLWDGAWETAPADVTTTWNDGVENRALVVGDCHQPDLQAATSSVSGGTLDATFQFTAADDGVGPDPDSLEVTVGGEPASATVGEDGVVHVHVEGLTSGKRSVRVHLVDRDGRPPESGDAFLPLWVEDTPWSWESGPMYYAFLDRFADGGDDGQGPIANTVYGTDYLGGDLVGAREKLDAGWFDDLGVKTIWLSPQNDNPDDAWIGSDGTTYYSGYHGYWPIKARSVEEHLGTTDEPADEALKAFVDDAHQHGIRVVLDLVLNHVHQEHEYVTEHPDWFTAPACVCTSDPGPCNWDTNPIGCWFTSYLPDLDYKNQAIVDQMVSDVQWWVETYDVDGFRIDAAKHMDHVILRTLSMKLKERYEAAGGAHFYLVGETFTGQGGQGLIMNYVAPYELDGQFDFPLLYPIRNGIGHGYGFKTLSDEVKASDAAYGANVHAMSVFMGNHDVERYATEIAGCDEWQLFDGCRDVLAEGASDAMTSEEWDLVNRLSMSYVFVATQPGVPMLYYGDEIGLAGSTDPDNRRPMQFDDLSMAQQTLLGRAQAIGQLRNATPALQTGERTELWVDDDLYVYARDNGGGDVAIVAMRMGTSTRTQAVPVPTGLSLEGKTLVDALAGNRSVTVTGGSMDVTLDPWEYVVLVPR